MLRAALETAVWRVTRQSIFDGFYGSLLDVNGRVEIRLAQAQVHGPWRRSLETLSYA